MESKRFFFFVAQLRLANVPTISFKGVNWSGSHPKFFRKNHLRPCGIGRGNTGIPLNSHEFGQGPWNYPNWGKQTMITNALSFWMICLESCSVGVGNTRSSNFFHQQSDTRINLGELYVSFKEGSMHRGVFSKHQKCRKGWGGCFFFPGKVKKFLPDLKGWLNIGI